MLFPNYMLTLPSISKAQRDLRRLIEGDTPTVSGKPKRRVPRTERMTPSSSKNKVAPTLNMEGETPRESFGDLMRKSLRDSGVEGVDDLSSEELKKLHDEMKSRDPLLSSDTSKKAKGIAFKLKRSVSFLTKGVIDSLDSMDKSGHDPDKKAAQALRELVPNMMMPYRGIIKYLEKFPDDAKSQHKYFTTVNSAIREQGREINETLGPLKNRQEDAVRGLTTVLGARYKEAMKRLRERGATPEQAAEAAASMPEIRKIKEQRDFSKTVSYGIGFMLTDFGQRYVQILKLLKQLEAQVTTKKAASYKLGERGIPDTRSEGTDDTDLDVRIQPRKRKKRRKKVNRKPSISTSDPSALNTSKDLHIKLARTIVSIEKKTDFLKANNERLLDLLRHPDHGNKLQREAKAAAAKQIEKLATQILAPLEFMSKNIEEVRKLVFRVSSVEQKESSKETYTPIVKEIHASLDKLHIGIDDFLTTAVPALQKIVTAQKRTSEGLNSTYQQLFQEKRNVLLKQGMSKENANKHLRNDNSLRKLARAKLTSEAQNEAFQAFSFNIDGIRGSFTNEVVPNLKRNYVNLIKFLLKEETKAASFNSNITKKLNKVAKRIVLLAYLRSRSN